jgi:hypothetical protein
MKPVFRAPRDMLARKPAHGAACNHCGLCCVSSLCDLAQYVLENQREQALKVHLRRAAPVVAFPTKREGGGR